MSYSRWSNSVWYTFWTAYPGTKTEFKLPTKKLKDSQMFEICDFPSYYITYGSIKKQGLDQILKDIEEFYSKEHDLTLLGDEKKVNPKNPTKEEMHELRGYLHAFVEDIDEHFSLFNFFTYEWYYPMRNKIMRSLRWRFKK